MISVLLGAIMGIAQYYSKPFCDYCYKYKMHLISFSGGIFLTYVILKLLPSFSGTAAQTAMPLYLTILLGFVLFYLIEKYIYQHHSKNKRVKEIELENSTISFISHFILGMWIAMLMKSSVSEGFLFFIPSLFQTAIRTLPFKPTHSKPAMLFLSSSTLLGVLFVGYIYPNPSLLIYHVFLGFVIGSILFVVTRHSLPFGGKGKPLFFAIGVALYTLLILLENYFL